MLKVLERFIVFGYKVRIFDDWFRTFRVHRAKTSTLTPSFYRSFPMSYTWLTIVPSLKKIMVVNHFRSKEVTLINSLELLIPKRLELFEVEF